LFSSRKNSGNFTSIHRFHDTLNSPTLQHPVDRNIYEISLHSANKLSAMDKPQLTLELYLPSRNTISTTNPPNIRIPRPLNNRSNHVPSNLRLRHTHLPQRLRIPCEPRGSKPWVPTNHPNPQPPQPPRVLHHEHIQRCLARTISISIWPIMPRLLIRWVGK
jgi:hypothetical protein